MKILHLCSKFFWEHKMSRVRFHGIDAISRHPDVTLIKSGPGWVGFKDCVSSQQEHSPDLIVWYKPMEMPNYDKVTVPTCLRYNEMWDIEETTKEINQTKSRIIVCHHNNDISKYNHISNSIFINVPHCAEKSIFKDYGLNKNFDLQIIGLINPDIYPFRSRLKSLIENKIVPKYKIKYRLLNHPGGRIDDVNGQVINYAKQINSSFINLTCSSKFLYALAKYSEVPLCNSLLAADLPDENKDWYKNWMCVLNRSYSDDEIIDTLMYYLENKSAISEKVCKGYSENIKIRTQENYAEYFVKKVNILI